jgi:hypothetical protein
MRMDGRAHRDSPTCLRTPRLVQTFCDFVGPFRRLFGLLFVLLEAGYVVVAEVEAVA